VGPGEIAVGWAGRDDAHEVSGVLAEGAAWMARKGWPGWTAADIAPAFVAARIAACEMAAARLDGVLAGVCTLTRSVPEFWPDDAPGEAAYLHRLAVRRRFAGARVTPAIVAWCAQTARDWGCRALKLDCHPHISGIYLRLGFTRLDSWTTHPSDRSPYLVDRFVMAL